MKRRYKRKFRNSTLKAVCSFRKCFFVCFNGLLRHNLELPKNGVIIQTVCQLRTLCELQAIPVFMMRHEQCCNTKHSCVVRSAGVTCIDMNYRFTLPTWKNVNQQ